MNRIGMLLIAAVMTWQQVTPTDDKGCAGFVPNNYDSKDLSSHSQVYTQPSTDSGPSNNDNGHHYGNDKPDNHTWEDKGNDYGDNQGHGQFDQPQQGGYSWE